MSNSSRRTTTLIGGALFAAAVATASVATVPTVSADVGDLASQAQMRLRPVNAAPGSGTSGEDQNAAVIVAGTTAQQAADVQLLIPSDWEAGDRILLQVQADGSTPPTLVPVHQPNCQSVAQTISFAGIASVTLTGGPWAVGQGWSNGDGTGVLPDTNGGANNPDSRTPGTQTVRPQFVVHMQNDGTTCAGQPAINNQIEIVFSNSAFPSLSPGVPVVANSDQFELTISNIAYNVGASVHVGPVHVVPFARFVDETAGNAVNPAPAYFGGNDFNNMAAATMFTNNAFVAPVSIGIAGGSLIADGTPQPLGDVTVAELVGDALDTGAHTLFIPNVSLAGTPGITVQVTGNGLATGTAAITNGVNEGALGVGARITLNLVGMTAAAGVATISGLAATTSTAGDVALFLTGPAAPTKPMAYVLPDDQRYDGVAANGAVLYSDVNIPKLFAKFASSASVPSRIGGADRYETSARIAGILASCTEWAVVVSGTSYPDALSANFLAGSLTASAGFAYKVPVLSVAAESLPASIVAYLTAAGVKNVYVVGGTAAVSAAVVTALQGVSATKCTGANAGNSSNPGSSQKVKVTRVAGADRYSTNQAVIALGAQIFPGTRNILQLETQQTGKRTAIVATGASFADALAAGPASYNGIPLILTDGAALSASATTSLTANGITQVIIIGGSAAISDAVRATIESRGIFVERISGADRYATAAAFADFMAKGAPTISIPGAFDGGLGFGPAAGILLASGTGFADALSGGPLAWSWNYPIILTDPLTLSPATRTWMVANRATVNTVTALGLTAAVSAEVLAAANAATA